MTDQATKDNTSTAEPFTHVAAHDVPVPRAASEQARVMLATPNPAAAPVPDRSDEQAIRFLIDGLKSATDEATVTAVACATTGAVPGTAAVTSTVRDVDGAVFYEATPVELEASNDRVLLVIHGGSFIHGGGAIARRAAELLASFLSMRVWSVDYRMPPEHPFPAGLDDTVAIYRQLLHEHSADRIVVTGTSAGGNLAAALIHRAHDAGLPKPAGLVLHTPVVDLEMLGDTWNTLAGLDPSLENAIQLSHIYAGAENFTNPYASPLHGEVSYFPPTLLVSGTRDPVLSDTVRMHRKLRTSGVSADLILTEGEPHGGYFAQAPEDHDRMRIVQEFIDLQAPVH